MSHPDVGNAKKNIVRNQMFYSVHTNVARGLKKTLEKFNSDKKKHTHASKSKRKRDLRSKKTASALEISSSHDVASQR